MSVLKSKIMSYVEDRKLKPIIVEKNKIIDYLEDLQKQESKLWGVIIKDLKKGENRLVEDTNHLIYLINSENKKTLKKLLDKKDVKDFLEDIELIRKDFLDLRKAIKDQDRLKLLISNFTIKLVDSANYENFKLVFLLQRDLYEVLDRQDVELQRLLGDVSKFKINTNEEKIDVFINYLRDLRDVLAGHLDDYKHFEEERMGYSNTSNLLHELIKIFKQDLD